MNEAWINKSSRLPTLEDSDSQRCVMVWHVHQGCYVTSYHNVDLNPYITHWMSCPPAPRDAAELIRKDFESIFDYIK